MADGHTIDGRRPFVTPGSFVCPSSPPDHYFECFEVDKEYIYAIRTVQYCNIVSAFLCIQYMQSSPKEIPGNFSGES